MSGSNDPADRTPADSLDARPARRRGPGRPFAKGQSGNPSGLSKGTAGRVERARQLALAFAPRALGELRRLTKDPDPRVRLAACESLLDRAGLKGMVAEGERLQVEHTIDVEALRRLLVTRAQALAGEGAARRVLEVEVRPVEALPEALPPRAVPDAATDLPSDHAPLAQEGEPR